MNDLKTKLQKLVPESLHGELDKILDEPANNPKKVEEWPKYGRRYFWVKSDGEVEESIWGFYKGDRDTLDIGNVFRTEAEAERHVEYLKICKRIKDKIREVNSDRIVDSTNCHIIELTSDHVPKIATEDYPQNHKDYWIAEGRGPSVLNAFTQDEWKLFFGVDE